MTKSRGGEGGKEGGEGELSITTIGHCNQGISVSILFPVVLAHLVDTVGWE